ncbi:acyltransferase [Actinoplanes bogorensis]|uniref:Acyltransferase n=1 Tax=Paractinoplanes bogorensis TaxID=1610840 RepID=A0ABS5YIV2_9ACTN|nr:acyltransferase [Actinoplanes bogorensis]MBU2663395.1 acyltransferase [Actinoplanes bogorensis]
MTTAAGLRHSTVPAAAGSTGFRRDIEGLRAVAVLLVVLFHAGVPGVAGGYIGVDVFFVISGFLITSVMLREVRRTGGLSLIDFYARRARRILPAAAVVLVATLLASYHWLGFLRGDEIAGDVGWSALFAANFRFANTGLDYLASQGAASPVQHFWSLAVEEQFYLVWPAAIVLLLWLGFRWAIGYWLAAAVVASLAYGVLWQTGTWSYFSPFSRAWEIGAGCLLALVATKLDRIPHRLATAMAGVGLALIVVSALTFDETTTFPGYAAGLPVIATVMVLAGRGDSLLATWPLVWLGRLSYSFYLWHWPVLIIAQQAYGEMLSVVTRAALVLAALGLAAVTFFAVEEPIRRSGRLRRSHVITLSLAAWLIVAPLAVARWTTSTSPAAEPGHAEYTPRLGAP